MNGPLLRVDDLHVQPIGNASKPALHGVNLTVEAGETHAIVGPHECGLSTLGPTLMGSNAYVVTRGSIEYQGDDITEWHTDERAKAGMFLAFGHPQPIPGVSTIQVLRHAVSMQNGVDVSVTELRLAATAWMQRLGMDPSDVDRHLDRHLDDRLPRIEQRRNELLHMAMLGPDIAILDETAADPDIDSQRIIVEGIREICADRPDIAVVLLTDDRRLLDEISPDHVHLLVDGRIVARGGVELSARLESARLETDGVTAFRTDVAVNV